MDEQFPKSTCCISVLCHNTTQLCGRKIPIYLRDTLNKTLFESKRFQAMFLVLQAKTRGRRACEGVVDTTTVHQHMSRNLSRCRLPVFANQAAQTETLSDTIVCRQLHHCRMLLLEFLLQMTIVATRVRRLACQDTRDELEFFDEDQSPSLRRSVWSSGAPSTCTRDHHRRIMSVDFEWRFWPIQSLSEPTCTHTCIVSDMRLAVCPISSDRGANNCGRHCIPNQSNWPLKAPS